MLDLDLSLSGKGYTIHLFQMGLINVQEQFTLTWHITDDDIGKELKTFLKEKNISSRALTDIKFSGGFIKVNNVEKTVKYKLQQLDIVEVVFPMEDKNQQMLGENIPLEILYEDRDILVINKPPYMNTIPSREHPTASLANALVHYYESTGIHAAIHIVTRLDRDTSGLVLIAKHRHAHHLLSIMQQRHEIKRYYEAFVGGIGLEEMGTIHAAIGRNPNSIIEREVRMDGQYAVTHFQKLVEYPSFSHVRLKLETGRTHQIRVHMAFINHPLIGDDLYGGDVVLLERQALHCSEIQFHHPFQSKLLQLTAPLPDDMKQLLQLKESFQKESL
ncbi:RluA family pseudouridine synthase [Lederbergia graminis]|uniref:RluA family pseudouridine synthase n=1 Tax=Lederbergia graminis TaxID=735518 RepID=UPI0036D2CC5F